MHSRNKIVNTPLTNKSFQDPMGSSEYLSVETHHRRENNIELHETEQEKTLTNIDSGFREHNTDTIEMPHTPRLAPRRLTSTPLYPNDRNGNNKISMNCNIYHINQDKTPKMDRHLVRRARQTKNFRKIDDNPASQFFKTMVSSKK